MGEKVRRFINRSPRYVLRPEDEKTLRFSFMQHSGTAGVNETLMVNLSETGVAFIMDQDHHPGVGELIKVEIPVPGGERIAWLGRVMHVRDFQASRWFARRDRFQGLPKVIVGVHFEELPDGHSRALRRGIEQSFVKIMQEQKYRNLNYFKALFFQYMPRTVFYILLTLMALGFIYYFQLPDAKYDAKRGTQWGERFKF